MSARLLIFSSKSPSLLLNPDPSRRLGLTVEVWEAERYAVDAIRNYAAENLARPGQPTAIFAVNDVIAVAVIQQASELGLQIRRDLSVVGFNDLDIASYIMPSLTTIRTPAAAKGARAVEILVDAIGGLPLLAHATPPIEFVMRDSTGPVSAT